MKSKFKKLMAAALVLCLMLALLPAGVLAEGTTYEVKVVNNKGVTPANGTVTLVGSTSGEATEFAASETVTVTPAAKPGYRLFSIVASDNVADWATHDGTYSFTMPEGEVTLTVQFQPVRTITVDTLVNGTVTAPADAMVQETVNLTVTADSGYEIDKVYYIADGVETVLNAPYSFVMPNTDVTVGATFKETTPVDPEPPVETTFDVNVDHNYGGDAWADYDTDLEAGKWVTITVDPYDGYWLESLTVGGVDVTDQVSWDWYWYYGRTGTYSFNVAGNTNVYATFATRYDDDIACIYDGRYGNVTVKVWDEVRDKFVTTTSADKGDLVAVIVEPYSGYAMSDLTIRERNDWDYVSYDSSWKYDNVYYFYMPGDDVNIYVDFTEAASEHIVYVDTAKNGTLKADTTWAAYGQKVYVTATPDKGYELSSLFVKTARGEQLKVYEAKSADTYYFYMPDEYVTVSAWFAPEASALPFADVSYTNWYYDAVKFVYDKGIMDGVSYYRFAPDATITRGMVVTMLWRMAGEPYESSAGFTDVASGRYYSTAVAWAAKNGIVEGMTSSTFAPDQAITREQLASILYRYAKWLGFSGTGTDISGYTDAGKVSGYAYDAMCWAVKTGVVTGTSAKVLDPQGTATRAAAAQMFMNFYNYIY